MWRYAQRNDIREALAALAPLRDALAPRRSATSSAVAPDRDVAGLAFLTAILRWPDRSQARGYLEGFQVIGDIPTSRVFRQVAPPAPVDVDKDFFGDAAVREVQDLLASPPPQGCRGHL